MIRPGALLVLLLAVTAGACASRSTGTTAGGPVPRPFPGAPLPPGAEPAPASVPPVAALPPDAPVPVTADSPRVLPIPTLSASPLINTALSFRGVPYRYGGSDPSGFDCSGFVQYVFAQHGTQLPRVTADQYQAGEEVDLDDVEAGDLIFFETAGPGPTHVGIALNDQQFVHAPSSTGVVRIERYTSSYWEPKILGARRIR